MFFGKVSGLGFHSLVISDLQLVYPSMYIGYLVAGMGDDLISHISAIVIVISMDVDIGRSVIAWVR